MNSRWYDCATFLDFFNCCNLHWEFEILEQKERRSKRTRRARLELSKFTATFSFGYGDFKIKTMLSGIFDSHLDNGVHNWVVNAQQCFVIMYLKKPNLVYIVSHKIFKFLLLPNWFLKWSIYLAFLNNAIQCLKYNLAAPIPRLVCLLFLPFSKFPLVGLF